VPIELGSQGSVLGPAVAIAAVVLLALFLRWAVGTGSGRRRKPSPVDDGLLTRIATLSHQESALALRAVFSDAGIRSTIRYVGPGRAVILVFPEDAERARQLASSFDGPDQS
jgi:hypothetical protein